MIVYVEKGIDIDIQSFTCPYFDEKVLCEIHQPIPMLFRLAFPVLRSSFSRRSISSTQSVLAGHNKVI